MKPHVAFTYTHGKIVLIYVEETEHSYGKSLVIRNMKKIILAY